MSGISRKPIKPITFEIQLQHALKANLRTSFPAEFRSVLDQPRKRSLRMPGSRSPGIHAQRSVQGTYFPMLPSMSFNEIIPSMNDIFIRTVTEQHSRPLTQPSTDMKKILLIIQREYLTRVKKRSFIVMTILGPLLMAAIIDCSDLSRYHFE